MGDMPASPHTADPSTAAPGADVLSKLGHELRSPLTGIIGLTKILLTQLGVADPARQARQLDMIQSSARQSLATIERVVDIANLQSGRVEGDPRLIDCRGVVADAAATFAAAAQERGLRLRTDLPDHPVTVYADTAILTRTLRELLDNAVKFADPGEVVLHAGTDRGRPIVEVSDDGPGIPAGDQERIFEAFERGELAAERDDEGAGLGLYLARLLADRLGACLSARSPAGRTTFTITFPDPDAVPRH